MIVLKENERLYLTSWEYNSARILTKLEEIIKNQGGNVAPSRTAIVSNRSLESQKREYIERLEHLTSLEEKKHDEKRTYAIKTYSEKLTELELIGNVPIKVTHITYISFTFDGFYYYYQTDDNPFFEFYYTKAVVVNGKYSRDCYLSKDNKDWIHDNLLSMRCNESDIDEAASAIFNMLISSKPSEKRCNRHKTRVPNIYNDGYHYEMVYEPERFEKIEF